MPPLRVLVADDEPLARAGLADLLADDPEVEVVGECADGAQTLAAVEALRPDLLLLDVQMPGLDGFEVLRAAGARAPLVIFVTAYDRHAVRAFDVRALDYLVKPFADERFHAAVARAKEAVRGGRVRPFGEPAPEAAPAAAPGGWLTRLVVKHAGRALLVRADEVEWIEAADYYVRVHHQGRAHLVRETMAALEARLDPARFFRAHRSAIVNLDRVREIRPAFRGEHTVVLRDGHRVPLTRGRRRALERLLRQSL